MIGIEVSGFVMEEKKETKVGRLYQDDIIFSY